MSQMHSSLSPGSCNLQTCGENLGMQLFVHVCVHKDSPRVTQSKGRKERQVDWGEEPVAVTHIFVHVIKKSIIIEDICQGKKNSLLTLF